MIYFVALLSKLFIKFSLLDQIISNKQLLCKIISCFVYYFSFYCKNIDLFWNQLNQIWFNFQNGLLSSLPYLGKYVMAVLASALADRLLRKGTLTTTQTRKIFTTFATMTPGILMIVQVFLGYDRTWSVVIFTTQLFLNGAVTAGYLGNGLDIAPNFSGTIFGLANTMSSIGGYVSTLIVGTLTAHNVSGII